jgi:ATP-dependent phosphofructokinase / diphosphate-dependent phosphofructokinase
MPRKTAASRKGPPSSIRRIAVSTGGGDAPGLNAVIRASTLAALEHGWEVVGIRDGYNGLLHPGNYPWGGLVHLNRDAVKGITHLGGTIIGSTNKGNPFRFPVKQADGTWIEEDRGDLLVEAFRREGIDALISVGGDGSLAIAHKLAERGLPVIGVPKTIDNDLDRTVITFGFDTAVSFATDCVDRLHSTAEAHGRIMVVEVMGRYAGWIALNCAVAGSADAVLIPEIPYDIVKVAEKLSKRFHGGGGFAIVVVAEGAKPVGGEVSVKAREIGRAERLGGVGEKVASQLQERTGHESRCVVLGHLLRGGRPTSFDRLLSLRFGAAAVRALAEGHRDVMVTLNPPRVDLVPLAEVSGRMKTVPLDSDTVLTARELGMCFGD